MRVEDWVDFSKIGWSIAEIELEFILDLIPLWIFRVDLLIFFKVIFLKIQHFNLILIMGKLIFKFEFKYKLILNVGIYGLKGYIDYQSNNTNDSKPTWWKSYRFYCFVHLGSENHNCLFSINNLYFDLSSCSFDVSFMN